MPGCRAPLAELVTYLAEAPKSTRAYEGYNRAERLVKRGPKLLMPIAMRDIPVESMEVIGNGKAYKYQPEYLCVGLPWSRMRQHQLTFVLGIQ
jgi:putative ATPase